MPCASGLFCNLIGFGIGNYCMVTLLPEVWMKQT